MLQFCASAMLETSNDGDVGGGDDGGGGGGGVGGGKWRLKEEKNR